MASSNSFRELLLIFGVCLALVVLGQWANKTYNGELAGNYDEPAHYVTALMVRQFALDPFQPPMAFAESYYLHYPKVGLGHWPPMLYIVLAAWSIPFGASQTSMLVCIAMIAAAAAALLFSMTRRLAGLGWAVAVTALWLLQPYAQQAAATVMSEPLLILLCLASVASYQRFLTTESWRWGALFGLCAAGALLTKGTALSLALTPPLAIVLSGRFRLLLNWRFWLPAVIVLALAGPWYLLADSFIPSAHGTSVNRAVNLARIDTATQRASTYFAVGGVWISAGIALGYLLTLAGWVRGKADRLLWAPPAALLIAACATHFALPESSSARHLAYVLPVGLMFVAGGLQFVSKSPGAVGRVAAGALLAALFAGFWTESFKLYEKPTAGMLAALEALGEPALAPDNVILVCADSREEGAFIAEIAERRPTPGPIVLRASKVFAASSWGGWSYTLRLETEEDIARYLEQSGVRTVVLGSAPPARAAEHYHLAGRSIESNPASWKLVFTGEDQTIRVYQALAAPDGPGNPIRIDMGGRLHKTLEITPGGSKR